jgi:hypothetical protein
MNATAAPPIGDPIPLPPTVAYTGDPLPEQPVWTPTNHIPTCGTHDWMMVAKLKSGPVEYYKYQCGRCQAVVGDVYDDTEEEDDGEKE